MNALHLDFETRSRVDLTKVGAQRYAEDASTEIVLGAGEFDGQPLVGFYGELPPPAFVAHVAAGGRVVAHSAAFERSIWNARVAPQTGVYMTVEQMDCTLARGQAAGLPAGLEPLGKAVRADVTKDKDGHALMMRMCKPQKDGSFIGDPEKVQRLGAYCAVDVKSEVAVDRHVPHLSDRERRIWILNQKMNDRGVLLDMPFVHKAQALVEYAQKQADDRIWRLTGGQVERCTQTARIVAWLDSRGIPCTSVADGETEDLVCAATLFDDEAAVAVIELRRASVKAFKFATMLLAACRDGRVRGSVAYHGAHTGRDAGRIIQPQNMKRLDDDAGDPEKVRMCLSIIGAMVDPADMYEALYLFVGDVLEALSVCARACIIAARGRRLIGGDFSNIEGRVAAWLAGARWKLDAFRARDAKLGPDLYKVTAGVVLGKHADDVTKQERQEWGKVPELACGYQGALNAFKKMMAKYGMRLPDAKVMTIVRGWREGNPEIVESWWELETAVIDAVSNPGMIVPAMNGKVRWVVSGDFLYLLLPSSRIVAYAQPHVGWTKKKIVVDGDEVEINKRAVSYWGVHKGRFMKLDLYGGMEFNHCVQGLARDIMYDAALRVEDAGYPLILPVHDELLGEPEDGFGSVEEFTALMEQREAYSAEIPLTVSAWEGPRYDK